MALKATLTVQRRGALGKSKEYEACVEIEGYHPVCHYGRNPDTVAAGAVKYALQTRQKGAAMWKEPDPFAGHRRRKRRSR